MKILFRTKENLVLDSYKYVLIWLLEIFLRKLFSWFDFCQTFLRRCQNNFKKIRKIDLNFWSLFCTSNSQNFIDKLMKFEKLKTYILSSLTFTPSYVYRTDYWYKSNCYFYWILSWFYGCFFIAFNVINVCVHGTLNY